MLLVRPKNCIQVFEDREGILQNFGQILRYGDVRRFELIFVIREEALESSQDKIVVLEILGDRLDMSWSITDS